MALNTDGVNIIITGDASQAIKAIEDTQQATENLKDQTIKVNVGADVDVLGRLHAANGQFMTMGEKLASQFSSGFMKKVAEWSVKVDGLGKGLEASFGTIFKTITAGASTVATALGMVARSALAIGGGFEAQMTSVKVISGATEEELDALTQKAREMGATLPISAKDAATAMTLLAQRGTNAKDILASVADVANLAISQSVSMGEAADLLGSTITNFGLAMEDASKVTAIFNNASNQSNLSMGKLIEAMKYVGPTAGSIGMELTEAISGMEALANAGLTGEMTGTGLAMVLTKLAQKSRIMGVETKDMQGNLRPLADIFSELQAKGFSLAEATAEFGARGKLAALNLAKQSASLKENEEHLKNWGSTQAAVDEKAKTFTNTMAAFRSAVEELHIEVFEQIKEQSKGAVSGITELVRAFSEWIGQTKIAEKALNAFLEGLGFNIPTGTDFKKLLAQIDVDAIAEKIKTLGSTIKNIVDNIAAFADNIKTPILFIIKHLDSFATISFWGWIIGKGLQVPLVLINLASAFNQLYSALKVLAALELPKLLGFLMSISPSAVILTGTIGAIGLALNQVKKHVDAKYDLEKTLREEKRYLREQAEADSTLDLDIKLNVKTGFEKLPESWAKASDELREKANATVQELRDAFKQNVATAIDAVIAKFPDMADALKDSVGNLSNSTLSQLSKALQGDEEAFKSLPPHMQKVAEQLYYMGVRAGQASESFGKILIAQKELQSLKVSADTSALSDIAAFSQELSASINSIIEQIPDNIERLQKFLGGQNLELPVNVSLAQANQQLQTLSKSLADKFNIPADIVSSAVFSRLQALADTGDKTAQSLRNSWKDAGVSLDDFLATAQEAIQYMGASPEKFTPALNSLMRGIQKIDPLTGKLTEQFKKAYDTLKQWGSVTFDQLSQRIQRLRNAVEGGFIDSSALEAEARNALQQIKVQVVADLAPVKDSFRSQSAYFSTVASEVYNKAFEMGGEVFAEALRKETASYYDQSGETMGRAFVRQAEKGMSGLSSSSIKINGVEVTQKEKFQQGVFDYQSLAKAFSDSFNPYIAKIDQAVSSQTSSGNELSSRIPDIVAALNKLQTGIENNSSVIARANDAVTAFASSIGNVAVQNSNSPVYSARDYSAEFAGIVKELQSLSASLVAVQNIGQANISAVQGVSQAVNAVEAAVKSQQSANLSVDAASITQAVTSGITPLISRLDAQGNIYQSASSTVSRSAQALEVSVDNLKRSTDSNVNAMASLQNALSNTNSGSGSGESFTGALAPLLNSVQSLAVTVGAIQGSNQENTAAIAEITNAVKAVEAAVKSINAGNTFDIDINQQGFIIDKKADADLVARNTVSALRSGIGNGGV